MSDPTPSAGDKVSLVSRGHRVTGLVTAVRKDRHLGTYYVVKMQDGGEVNRYPDEVKVVFG